MGTQFTRPCPRSPPNARLAAGSHGTHVAGIVGAYHPHHPELSGVAPGYVLRLRVWRRPTQPQTVCALFFTPPGHATLPAPRPFCSVRFVGVKIGDTRLGSMETAVGLSRGIKAGAFLATACARLRL
jgi:hypothetical protein